MRSRPVDEFDPRRRRLPASSLTASGWPAAPRRERRVTLASLRRDGDAAAAGRAGGTLPQFVAHQRDLFRTRPRARADGAKGRCGIDSRLWLDDGHWLAWTICGELVSVEEIEPGSMRGSPEVRRLDVDELPAVFAAGRLIPTVIALYRGDQLARGPVRRYIAHHDLGRALEAALARARTDELLRLAETAPIASPVPAAATTLRAARTQKTRHHPLGNFIVYRAPRAGEDLPSYAAVLELPPVPEAFPDRRGAIRFLARMPRLGLDQADLEIARVLRSVEVQPVWRPGIQVPRDPKAIVELIRREPRVVLPDLKATWLPRYVQVGDGTWELKRAQKRGTVRGRLNEILLHRVSREGRRFAAMLQENAIRRRAGFEEMPLESSFTTALRLVHRAERRLPESWFDQLGTPRESLSPDWSRFAKAAEVAEAGHWLRAPCEHGRAHSDGQRRRIVELHIDDLAALLEVAGMRPRFLLVKRSTASAPKWMLAGCLANYSTDS
jgi:hypothetical protein